VILVVCGLETVGTVDLDYGVHAQGYARSMFYLFLAHLHVCPQPQAVPHIGSIDIPYNYVQRNIRPFSQRLHFTIQVSTR